MTDSVNCFLKVRKEDVFLICPYLESFEGMAAIRTPRPADGPHATLKLMVSPDFQADLERVLTNLGKKLWLERVVE